MKPWPTILRSILLKGFPIFIFGLFFYLSHPANAKIPNCKGNEVSECYFQLGRQHANEGNYKIAINLFSKAIEADPQNLDAYNFRGAVYFEIKSFNKALNDFDKTLAMNPKCGLCYRNRAQTKEQLEDWLGAYEDYTSAIALSPKDPDLYYYRANLHIYLKIINNNESNDTAIKDLGKCLELDSKSATRYYRLRASIFDLNSEYEKAISDYQKLLDLGEDGIDIFLNLGASYSDIKKYDIALEYYFKAIAINPEYELALLAIAKTYSVLNNKQEALRYLKLALEKDGLAARVLYDGKAADYRWDNIRETKEFQQLINGEKKWPRLTK